jgi:regulatory protein
MPQSKETGLISQGQSEKGSKRDNIKYQAQGILAHREHSEWEVRTKLNRKGFSAEGVDEVIVWLKQEKLLDDERFAETYVEGVLRSKTVGPRWLVHKLQQKRVAHEIIEPAVYSVINDQREKALAREAATRWRIRQQMKNFDERARQRLMRFLVSRGFSVEVVQEELERLATFS